MADPTETDPDKYAVVFQNDRVRVLEYRDEPGAKTNPHDHPDSVMITLSGFERRLTAAEQTRDVVSRRVRSGGWMPRRTPARTSARRRPTPSSSS